MTDDSGSSIQQQQVEEYQNQLRDVEELLQLTPDDESLLLLKADLDELIRITLGHEEDSIQEQQHSIEKNDPSDEVGALRKRSNEAISTTTTTISFTDIISEAAIAADETNRGMIPPNDALHSDQMDHDNKKEKDETHMKQKKAKGGNNKTTTTSTLKEFEVPNHLIPVEGESEAERNKKRRAIKALKNKYREKKKEMESTMKQQSWQNFQKKTKKSGGSGDSTTIFSTATSSTTNMGKVGVVTVSGGRHITEYGERKRHK